MNESVVLDRDACRALLDTAVVGRVVYVDSEPRIRPVNYVCHGDRICFRSDTPTPHDELVTFEVDHVDPVEHHGWSVIVRGVAHAHLVDDVDTDLLGALEPWAAGPKDWLIVVVIDAVGGRWVRHVDELAPPPGGYL